MLVRDEADRYVFAEVNGVTVTIGPKGRYDIPSVCAFPETGKPGETALDAAVYADEWWAQKGGARGVTGHDDSVISSDWKCRSKSCPCQTEPYDKRKRRSRSY